MRRLNHFSSTSLEIPLRISYICTVNSARKAKICTIGSAYFRNMDGKNYEKQFGGFEEIMYPCRKINSDYE